MRRRDFITGIAGSAATWPLAAHAQQAERIRRIGVLMNLGADDPESPPRLAAFVQALEQLGWRDGRNVRIDYRWSASDPERERKYASELVALAPDVILASASTSVAVLQQATRTLTIVFVQVTDPVGAGFVASLARPGGNTTGFSNFEYGISAKWLELLKQTAPGVRRVAVIRDPATAAGIGQLGAMQSAASSFGVELSPIDARDASEIDSAVTTFSHSSNGSLIAVASPLVAIHRKLIITLAARHRLPAIYPFRYFVTGGGLMSYGPDSIAPYGRAAAYVDRILKGEKPADLPVQAPVKYELAVNLKTAKALGLTVPNTLLAIADEVIE